MLQGATVGFAGESSQWCFFPAKMPAAADSSNLRELLRSGEDDAGDARPRDAAAKITLAAVLGSDVRHGRARMSRTLLDIIRDDAPAGRPPCDDGENQNNHSRMSWRIFLERLRLRPAGASFASSVHAPPPDVPDQIRTFQTAPDYPDVSDGADPPPSGNFGSGISLRSSNTGRFESVETTQPEPRQRLAAALAAESELLAAAAEEESSGREAPARMSLMALLEEADRQMRGVMPGYAVTVEEDEEEEEEGEESYGGGRRRSGEFRCCVCMVRYKGAAFIPCGHTFCRRCSRELWVSRGSCPTCNGAILEILDIF